MAGEIIPIGPFTGGLSNRLDPSSINDNELVDLVNYEVSEDGTLVNRPVIYVNQWGNQYGTGGNGITSHMANGYAVQPIVVGRYKNDGAAILYKWFGRNLYWERMNDAANSLSINTNKIDHVTTSVNNPGMTGVQYNNYMYFTNAKVEGLAGRIEIGTNTFSNIGSLPRGQTILSHKSRLFVFPGPQTTWAENDNNSKFYYTAAPYTGGSWNHSENFINVGYGDGQYITGALIYNGDILIFKENSTWRFAYEAAIEQGMLEVINPNVGSENPHSTTVCNGIVYTFYQGSVHEIYNYQWSNVSQRVKFDKVPLESGETYVDGVNLSTLGDRVILNHYGKTYVYSQRSRSWSEWETETPIGHGITVPDAVLDSDNGEMLLSSYYKNTRKPANINQNWEITRLYRVFNTNEPISDVPQSGRPADSQDTENFECRIRTKSYDIGADSAFKRLMWWGASVLTTTDVQGQATVVVNNASFTYDQLHGTPYADLTYATWDNLLDILPEITTDVDAESYTSHGRRFIKFLKGLRFRQIFFTYKTKVDGTSNTLPNKLYTLTTVIRGKGKMTKEIS